MSFQVGVFIETGSKYENDKNNGISRFLEHLIHKVVILLRYCLLLISMPSNAKLSFQGTGKRAQAQLESELESIGAKLRSSTDRDHTAVYIQSASEDVEKG